MNALKRIILFLVCFVVIGLVASVILGAIVGAAAVRDAGNAASATELAGVAGRDFGSRYGLLIWLGSLVLSAGIAFRWIGAIIATAIAALVYFSTGKVTRSPKPVTQSVPTPSTALPQPNGANVAQQRAILRAVQPHPESLVHGHRQAPMEESPPSCSSEDLR